MEEEDGEDGEGEVRWERSNGNMSCKEALLCLCDCWSRLSLLAEAWTTTMLYDRRDDREEHDTPLNEQYRGASC